MEGQRSTYQGVSGLHSDCSGWFHHYRWVRQLHGYSKRLQLNRKLMPRLPRSIRPPRVVNIEDLRRLANKRVPKAVFDSSMAAPTRNERCEKMVAHFRKLHY